MAFQVTALAEDEFAALSHLSQEELAKRDVVKIKADVSPGFPCRVSLQDAAIGETLFLLNYMHHDVPTPYRSSHAIFVREGATQTHPPIDSVPSVLAIRLISVRAFDHRDNMIDADVVKGRDLANAINMLFENPNVAYLHLHNAKPGCYAARVDRVP